MTEEMRFSSKHIYEMTGLAPTDVFLRTQRILKNWPEDGPDISNEFLFSGMKPKLVRGKETDDESRPVEIGISGFGMFLLLTHMLTETDTVGSTGNVPLHRWLHSYTDEEGTRIFSLQNGGEFTYK